MNGCGFADKQACITILLVVLASIVITEYCCASEICRTPFPPSAGRNMANRGGSASSELSTSCAIILLNKDVRICIELVEVYNNSGCDAEFDLV